MSDLRVSNYMERKELYRNTFIGLFKQNIHFELFDRIPI